LYILEEAQINLMCISGMFVSAAIKGSLDLEAYLETIQNTKEYLRRESSK
jgi:hypothetical protein